MGRAANNAASLASLAGLAYLASRQSGQPSDDGGAPPVPAAPADQAPMGATDDGSNYSNEGRSGRNLAVGQAPASAPRPMAKTGPQGRSYSASDAQRMADYNTANKPTPYETPYDRMNRKNAEAAQAQADADAETQKLRRAHPAPGRGVVDTSRVNPNTLLPYKKGGKVAAKSKPTKMAKGGVTKSSASSRGDGIATRGKTKGRFV